MDYKNIDSFRNEILNEIEYAAFIHCFNRYELIAKKLIQDNPITKHMPSSFFDYSTATIKSDVAVNSIYIGFGKISSSVYYAANMNDCLASVVEENGKKTLKEFPINSFAFDVNTGKKENKNTMFYRNRFIESSKSMDNKEYFPLPLSLCSLKFIDSDINEKKYQDSLNEILSQTEASKSYNSIVISFGTDEDNIDMALKFKLFLLQKGIEQYHIYVRVRDEKLLKMKVFSSKKITAFGYFSSVINHATIVDEELLKMAKLINQEYNSKRMCDSSWYELPAICQSSNSYASLNIRLKLHLLGFDYINSTKSSDTKVIQSLKDKISWPHKTYQDYLLYQQGIIYPPQAISYQEHFRWNAFYFNNGYVPMKISKLGYLNNGKFYKDDDEILEHACLTTYEGLDEYHRLYAKFEAKKSGKPFADCLASVETYKYDYMLLEKLPIIFSNPESGYELIEKDRNEEPVC